MKGQLYQGSVLYNIDPIGIGTENVESFSSYLIRIAFVHNITVGHLINKLVIPEMNKNYLDRSVAYGGNRFYEGAKSVNGYMENSTELVRIFQQLTSRKDLSSLTLYHLKDFIPLRNLLKECLSWCPECIKNWKSRNKSVYYPLIWFLKPVKICKNHKCLLNDRCPQCSRRIDVLRRQMLPGYCPHCFTSLDQDALKITSISQKLDWYLFVNRNLEDLILLNQQQISTNNFKTQICKHLNLINDQYFLGSVPNFSRYLDVPKSTLNYWLNGKSTPSLDYMLKISFKLNIKILDFLLESQKLDVKIFQIKGKKSNTKKISRKPLNHSAIEKKLTELLSHGLPISMKLAAKIVGHDRRVLYRKFPLQCKQISNRYKEYIKERSEQRIKQLKAEINQVFHLLINEGFYPSRRKIEDKLNKKGVLKEKVLQDYWKFLLAKSGFSKE